MKTNFLNFRRRTSILCALTTTIMIWTLMACGKLFPEPGEEKSLGFFPEEWIAPKGTLTDGASVPRLALWVTDGRFDPGFLKAAVIHDAYCQADNKDRCPEQYQQRPWKQVHRMFYEACLAGGTSPSTARIMFAAVWLAGPRWNDPERNLDGVPDEVILAEFEACKKWIEKKDPTVDEIEEWMDKREEKLLASQGQAEIL